MLIVFANYLVEVREERERISTVAGSKNMTTLDVKTENGSDTPKLTEDGQVIEIDDRKVHAKAVMTFPAWLEQRREVRMLLGRKSLD